MQNKIAIEMLTPHSVSIRTQGYVADGGFIYFEAKNRELVKHYEDAFGAHLIGTPHEYSMIIDEDAAPKLLNAYTLGKED